MEVLRHHAIFVVVYEKFGATLERGDWSVWENQALSGSINGL